MKQEYFYLSDVEFDLMTDDELISFYGDEDYQYEQYLLEKEAMETSYQHVK